MKEEDLTSLTNSIKEKIGEESTALIADDLGILFTKNNEILNTISEQETKISSLQETNERLVLANGNLLKQVPMSSSEPRKTVEQEDSSSKKSFNFRSMFDSHGNFKQDL